MPDKYPWNLIVLYMEGQSLTVQSGVPVNSHEINELNELNRKGLAKIVVVDAANGFITDKNNVQKLIDELSHRDKVQIEMVDRSAQGHNLVQLHASNIWLRKTGLSSTEYERLVREEDRLLKSCRETKPD